jgi:hypothetical protein
MVQIGPISVCTWWRYGIFLTGNQQAKQTLHGLQGRGLIAAGTSRTGRLRPPPLHDFRAVASLRQGVEGGGPGQVGLSTAFRAVASLRLPDRCPGQGAGPPFHGFQGRGLIATATPCTCCWASAPLSTAFRAVASLRHRDAAGRPHQDHLSTAFRAVSSLRPGRAADHGWVAAVSLRPSGPWPHCGAKSSRKSTPVRASSPRPSRAVASLRPGLHRPHDGLPGSLHGLGVALLPGHPRRARASDGHVAVAERWHGPSGGRGRGQTRRDDAYGWVSA